MATKVLSIEIGQGVTNVVEMDYRASKTKIYNCFSFETPEGVIKDGMVHRNDLFTSLFKTECTKLGIRTKKAVFVVASSRLASRDVKVPLVKEKRLTEVVTASANDFFPVDMSQYHLVHKILEKINTPEEKAYRLNVLAVPNDLTASYFDLARSLDLELVTLDYVGNSILQTVGKDFSTGINAIVKVEEANTLVTVLEDGKVVLQRTLIYGVADTIREVMGHKEFGENLSYMDAIRVLSGKTIIRKMLNTEATYSEDEDTTGDIKAARIDVTETLRYLIGNVGRVLEFYSSRNDNAQIHAVALTGMGADFSGLSKLMTNELGQTVKVYQRLESATFSHASEDTGLKINAYAACIGAGMAPLSLIPEEKRGGKKNAEKKKSSGGGMLAIGILGLLAMAAACAFLWYTTNEELNQIKADQAAVRASIEQMRAEGVEIVYNDYNAEVTLNDQLKYFVQSTKSRSEDLVAFIEELEEKLPSDLLVLTFSATNSGVSMSVECDSKESAAKTLMQLRTFESVQIVSSSGLSDGASLDQEAEESGSVTFSVEMVYKPVAYDETEGGN